MRSLSDKGAIASCLDSVFTRTNNKNNSIYPIMYLLIIKGSFEKKITVTVNKKSGINNKLACIPNELK